MTRIYQVSSGTGFLACQSSCPHGQTRKSATTTTQHVNNQLHGLPGRAPPRPGTRGHPDGVTGGMRTASAYALLGEKEKALAQLEHGAEKGEFWLFQIKYDPAYEPLKGDPRFQALLKKFDPPQ